MTILAGPLASGKTTRILELLRTDLAQKRVVRLIVPTATLAEHLRYQLAREGASYEANRVLTLAALVSQVVPEWAPPSRALLHYIIRTLPIAEFESVNRYPGFRERLLRLIEELADTGVNPESFSRLPNISAAQQAVAKAFATVTEQLAQRGFALAGLRNLMAAARIRRDGLPGVKAVYLDGFFAFSKPELEILRALSAHVRLTLTLPSDWPESASVIEALGVVAQNGNRAGGPPAVEKFSASSREQETGEIARRIVRIADSGGSLAHIGVIVRREKPYTAILQSAFARYGIPARFYFPNRLEQQSPIRYLSALVESILSGWDWERLLETVQLAASGYGATSKGDELDFTIRAKLPMRGLADLGELGEKLQPLDRWKELRRTPEQWSVALQDLAQWAFRGVPIEPDDHESAVMWRQRATAIQGWKDALNETATLLPKRAVPLDEFWSESKNVIHLTPLRVRDSRANCVHVVDVFESRQWRFDTVFVCGAVEGEFPEYPAPDPIFDDLSRLRLRAQGIFLRTSRDHQQIEDQLIDLAVTRASRTAVFSWPRFSIADQEILPAFALDRFVGEAASAPESRPEPAQAFRATSPAIRVEPHDIARIMPAEKKWRPSEIETFLECPFKYLGRYILKLEPAPPRPDERFGAREQGTLVHAVLRQLAENPDTDLDFIFDQAFRALERKDNIAPTHRVAWDRLEMLRSLRTVLAVREGWKPFVEWPFEFPLIEGLTVRGRIDRFDVSPEGEAFAIDYKYSRTETLRQRTKTETDVQGGLYLAALRHSGYRPTGFGYLALRGGGKLVETSDIEDLIASAREKTIDAVTRIAQGEIEARPVHPANCRYCDFLSMCRIRESSVALATALAGDHE